jgi:ATP-dependent Clp protease ATP-binding subunit ClpA
MATGKVEGRRKLNELELPFSFNSSLTDFTRDLTAAALRDELEPVTGRDREIDRVITILLRQSKNNPVLIGEAGVGKTAVVEGLAHRISANRVPSALKNVSILSLSHTDLLAGTSFRGQYEKRLKTLIDEASKNRFVILFIDELHNLIGAGSAIGAPMDAANMLKPALANGQIRVIGATTDFEYSQYIRADAALERRFQPVRVIELGREQTLEALRARQARLEMHHLLAITEGALEAATDLSLEYLPDRRQPDRSIDLLDETCARVRLLAPEHLPKEIVAHKLKRDQLLATERESIAQLMLIAEARGTSLERFSRGTYKIIEAMGLEVEKLITGGVTERPDLPLPDSIRRIQESDPEARLAKSRNERSRVEEELKSLLAEYHLVVSADDVRNTVGPVA